MLFLLFFFVSAAFLLCNYLVFFVPLAVLLRPHLSWQIIWYNIASLVAYRASIDDDIFSAECWSDWCSGCFAESGRWLLVARRAPNWADVALSPSTQQQLGFLNSQPWICLIPRGDFGTLRFPFSREVFVARVVINSVDFDSDLSMLPLAFPLQWQEDQRELQPKMIYWTVVWRKWKFGFFNIVNWWSVLQPFRWAGMEEKQCNMSMPEVETWRQLIKEWPKRGMDGA